VIILSVVILSVITYYVSLNKKSKYSWYKTFEDENKQPYDFGLFKKILKHQSQNNLESVNVKLTENITTSKFKDSLTYLFIGRQCFLLKEEIDSLLVIAENGNDIVFIAEELPDTLIQAIQEYGKPIGFDRITENKVNVVFNTYKEDSFSFRYRAQDKQMNEPVEWIFINDETTPSYYTETLADRFIKLSSLNDKMNFAKFRVGLGHVFIHTNPILFTNYFLKDSNGFNHLNMVLSEIKTDKILYDVASRTYKENAAKIIRQSETPLSFILKQPALKIAWYLMLAGAILFFLFNAKRMQRIIPVLDQKRNTSLQFSETISNLFYYTSDHKKLADIKMNLFTAFIRSKLGIATHTMDDNTYKQIALKAKVNIEDVKNIFNFYNLHVAFNLSITDKELIEFHKLVQIFNQQYYKK